KRAVMAPSTKHVLPDETLGLTRLLVASVQDYAVFAMDPTGVVLTWNAGAERIKGYRADEIVGRHFSQFYTPEDREKHRPSNLLEVARTRGHVEDEGWRVRKDGTRFWASVVITALRDDEGELVGYAKVVRDLTERKAAEERAVADARRIAIAETSSRAKSEFLAAMSHELRTPLNAIGGYAELLEMGVGGKLSEQQIEYITRIRTSQQHLLAIINDLLNYSRIEAGHVAYAKEAVDMHPLAERVMSMVAAQAKLKNIRLDHHGCLGHVWVVADQLKAEQIVLNLLSNAVKFTPEGGRVEVTCSSSSEQGFVCVRDSGPGIPEDKIEAIFEPFVQLGRTLASRQEGSGLGLAISRDLARAMGGDVTAESEVGRGARFTLSLPAK
ncbi:MAG TPA: PAS domain-containing sensor histidine kinase, partial [Gemmatimonadaceae bacterium]